VHTLPEHGQAVWAVVALEPCGATNQQPAVLTGAADNLIRLFIGDTADAATRVYKGHTQPVRALARHPDLATETFVSAGNDGSVRLWSLSGDQLAQLAGHDSFVYSLAPLPIGQGLVSGGEDRSVRVWRDADGECEQTITLPAISVWTVATLSSGDVVAGTNDGTIRIFSREPDRFADAAALADYEAAVAKTTINTQQIGDVKNTDLPGPEALAQPGRKEGQVKMIKNGDKVEAYMVRLQACGRADRRSGPRPRTRGRRSARSSTASATRRSSSTRASSTTTCSTSRSRRASRRSSCRTTSAVRSASDADVADGTQRTRTTRRRSSC